MRWHLLCSCCYCRLQDLRRSRSPAPKVKGDSASAFAYQLMLGVKYPIDEVEIGLCYKLMGTTEADFDGLKVDYLAHNVELGVTFRF